MTDENQRTRRPRLSQEMIAIVTVGVALAGLNLVTTSDLRDLRNEWQAESRQLRDEARADREAFQRQSETFQREILRLTEGQATLAAVVTSAQPGND